MQILLFNDIKGIIAECIIICSQKCKIRTPSLLADVGLYNTSSFSQEPRML